MVSKERAVAAVRARAPRDMLAKMLRALDVQDLAQWSLKDEDDDDIIFDYVQLVAQESMSVFVGPKSMLSAINMFAQLQITQFDYSASKASSSLQGDDFKARLQTFYCNTADAQRQLRCMLLNVKLPVTLVTGSHLFKYCWKAQLPFLLGLNDINDARNGLLLFKPLKHAFDDSRICFTYVEEAGEPKFKLKLLDPALEDAKLWDYAETHNLRKKYGEHQIDSYAATVTFGELQGKALVFQNDNRPYRRCLRFQVVQALRRAKANGWLPADWTPSADLTYNSEDAKERADGRMAQRRRAGASSAPGFG